MIDDCEIHVLNAVQFLSPRNPPPPPPTVEAENLCTTSKTLADHNRRKSSLIFCLWKLIELNMCCWLGVCSNELDFVTEEFHSIREADGETWDILCSLI